MPPASIVIAGESAGANLMPSTHIARIGGSGDDDAFYYRVHSPVVLIEYDCHQGVFLDNDQPEPFHVHTIVRTPDGGDHGRDLLRRHFARHHPQQRIGHRPVAQPRRNTTTVSAVRTPRHAAVRVLRVRAGCPRVRWRVSREPPASAGS